MENKITCENIRKFINDYKDNKKDVENWFEIKGPYNYCEYANILYNHQEKIYWEELTHIFRYDKRLHFVLYKYISFVEEFFRSLLFKLNVFEDEKILKLTFSELVEKIKKHSKQIKSKFLNKKAVFSSDKIVIQIRNDIAHSKVLLGSTFQNLNLSQALIRFEKWIPQSYVEGFKRSILEAQKNLKIPQLLAVNL